MDESKPTPAPPITDEEVRTILVNAIMEATARTNAASQAFIEIIGQYPGLARAGAKHIHDASRELSAARVEMMKAHKRLDEFLSTRIGREKLSTGTRTT